jgi:AcrR family transcriptional regulator
MDDIADRAGVSKPVLYQHFPSKLELYLALLDSSADALTAAVRAALASTHDNKLRVQATMQAYFDFVDDDRAAFRLVFESDLTGEPAVRERVDRVARECAEAVSVVIAEDTGLPRDESMLLAAGLAGMAQITARWWVAEDRPIPRDAASTLLATLAWRGIRGFPARSEG